MKNFMFKGKLFCLFLCIILLLSSCQIEKTKKSNETQKVTYRDSFTEEDMKHYMEPDTLKSRKDFEKKPTLFGRKLSKSMDMIAEKVDGAFSDKKIDWDDTSADLVVKTIFEGKNGETYSFIAYWGIGDEAFDSHSKAYSPIIHIKLLEGSNSGMDTNLVENIKEYLRDYNDIEVSFIEDKKRQERN